MKTKMVIRYLDGKDKVAVLSDVLDIAGLEESIERVRRAGGKSKEKFAIAVKPNASMYIRYGEDGITTDSVLVLALVERLLSKGYSDVRLVESSNLYEAGFSNREVVRVMAEQGMAGGYVPGEVTNETVLEAHVIDGKGKLRPYRLHDLSADTVNVPSPELPDGHLKLGRAYREADYRISFCAFKTHIYDGYTLLVKNTYGCLPEGNKMWHYHYKTGAARPTIAQLAVCPVHFGIIDGIYGCDGQAGVKWGRAIPPSPGFIFAGENIYDVEKAACGIMGVDYKRSYMSRGALARYAGDTLLDGEVRLLKNWENVLTPFVAAIPILERFYYLHRFVQMVTDFTGSKPFRRKPSGIFFTFLGCAFIVPPVLYAIQKRGWVILAARRVREHLGLRSRGITTPRAVAGDLARLDTTELETLLAILFGGREEVRAYGHKIKCGAKIYELPRSSFFSINRVVSVAEKAFADPVLKDKLISSLKGRIEYRKSRGEKR